MKDTIQIKVLETAQWVGGLYYKRNILFALTQNPAIMDKYRIIVTVCKDNVPYFSEFEGKVKIITLDEHTKIGKLRGYICTVLEGVKYAFPAIENRYRDMLGVTSVDWIPDFQHNYYPEFFDEEEIQRRTAQYTYVRDNKMPLVLSSNTCKDDFEKFYGKKQKTYVVPFVSYIEPELKQITAQRVSETLTKYNLTGKRFACISNQFWKHKNHIVVLQAIKRLHAVLGDFRFVFSGMPKDYRSPEYYKSLMELLNDQEIGAHVDILGFIDRTEQLVVMNKADFIVQPSLFEGWGTVVEDAKVLDKRILLSDIPVHREQMNENCLLFDPHDPADLAEKIEWAMKHQHEDNVEKGLKDMYERAKAYSEGFLQLLEDNKK